METPMTASRLRAYFIGPALSEPKPEPKPEAVPARDDLDRWLSARVIEYLATQPGVEDEG